MGVADLRPHPFPLSCQAQAKSDDKAATQMMKRDLSQYNIIIEAASLIGKVWLRNIKIRKF